MGDLTADAQARLLRFLNDRTYERLGEARERQADVRLIAATNRDLEAEVRAGRFREDLFYRLNVVTLTLPALRERPEDVLLLAHHYLSIFSQKQRRHGLTFAATAEQAMQRHVWPGNLRELRNAVERAVILAARDVLELADLGLPPVAPSDADSLSDSPAGRRARLDRSAGTRAHRARDCTVSLARSRGAHPGHRRDDASAKAQALWIGVIAS